MPFSDFCRETVFDPLDANRSAVRRTRVLDHETVNGRGQIMKMPAHTEKMKGESGDDCAAFPPSTALTIRG